MGIVDPCAEISSWSWAEKAGCQASSGFLMAISNTDLTELVKEKLQEFIRGAESDAFVDASQESVGQGLGKLFNKWANDFVDTFDFSQLFTRVTSEFQKEATTRFNQGLKNVLPWAAFGVGVIALASYARRRMYIKPAPSKVSIEIERYNLGSKIYDTTSETLSTLFKSTTSGVYFAICTKMALTLGVPALKSSLSLWPALDPYIPTGFTHFAYGIFEEAKNITSNGVSPFFVFFPNYKSLTITAPYLEQADKIAFGVGAVALFWGVASKLYQVYQKTSEKKPKGIFNQELMVSMKEIIHSAQNTQKNKGLFQSVFLYGEEGAGKGLFAKEIARSSNMNYARVSGRSIAQSQEYLREVNALISKLKSSQTPTVLHLDGSECLQEMESLEGRKFLDFIKESDKNLMIILSSNQLEDVDLAFLKTMDHQVHITAPDAPTRKAILTEYILKIFNEPELKVLLSSDTIDAICQKTSGFTGSTILEMLNTISRKKSASQDNKLTRDIIDVVVEKFAEQERAVAQLKTGPIEVMSVIPDSIFIRFTRYIRTPFHRIKRSKIPTARAVSLETV